MKVEHQLLTEQVTLAEKTKLWLETKEHFQPLIDEPLLREVDITWTAGGTLYLSASGSGENLTQIFKLLAKHSFRLPDHVKRPKEHQPEWIGRFQKLVGDPSEGLAGKTVSVFVSFSSTVCQFEQVGTETKEVPVYKIRCGDTIVESTEEKDFSDNIPF